MSQKDEAEPVVGGAAIFSAAVQLHLAGRLAEAEASYRRAIQLKPDHAEAHNNLGSALRQQGRRREAMLLYRLAVELKPELAEAHGNLGNLLWEMGEFEQAEASCRRAIELKPDLASAHNNLGNALRDQGRLDDAVASYQAGISLKGDHPEFHSNLGVALGMQGRLEEADDCFRQAMIHNPDLIGAHSNRLFALNYSVELEAEQIYEFYEAFNAAAERAVAKAQPVYPGPRATAAKLKVGYVSADFKGHACRNFLEPLLANHDRGDFEIYAYADNATEDAVTQRYKTYVDHWASTQPLSDEALSALIRSDGVDILVDLAGHTAGNRLGVFARKPAPVSLSWLGTGYTTGLRAIDYLLCDPVMVPPGSEGLFSETPWPIANAYAYRPSEGMGDPGPLPAEAANGRVTFGTLTRAIRVNDPVIDAWARLLRRVDGARLVINSADFKHRSMQERMLDRFARRGIGPERLSVGRQSPPWDVLRTIDIGLDCFPHNSGTTLFESLYMGVPFVTLADRPSVGRLGSSILTSLGRTEWIAADADAYVDIAAGLARDLSSLAGIRSGLRAEMAGGPLMDETGFARAVEAAYREMWRRLHP